MFIDANALTYFILKRDLVNQFYFSSDLNNLEREFFTPLPISQLR